MSKQRLKNTPRLSNDLPDPHDPANQDFDGDGIPDDKDEDVSVSRPEIEFSNYKKKEPMLKRILTSKIAKGIISVVGGVVGFGGSVFAGLDPDFAFVVAATAVIAIFGGMEKAAKFKGLFDNELKDQDSK